MPLLVIVQIYQPVPVIMDIHVWISTSVVRQLVNFKFRSPTLMPVMMNLKSPTWTTDHQIQSQLTRDQKILPESDPLDTQVYLSMLTCLHFLAAEKPPPYDWEDDLLVKRIQPFTPPSPPGPRLQENYFQLFFDNDFIQVSYSVILCLIRYF